jgi:hypothetical protein
MEYHRWDDYAAIQPIHPFIVEEHQVSCKENPARYFSSHNLQLSVMSRPPSQPRPSIMWHAPDYRAEFSAKPGYYG